MAWVSRTLSPLVWQTCAWCKSRKRAGSPILGGGNRGTCACSSIWRSSAVRVSRVAGAGVLSRCGRAAFGVGGLDVGHSGLSADAEHVHEVDRVGGVGGLVEDAVAAQL